MGEKAKQEQAKAVKAKPEEKAEKAKPEEKAEKEKKEKKPEKKEEPKPPSPFVLFMDLHCVGCAKKIERFIMKIRGVEGVVIDMAKNEVTIKGIVEPQAICDKIMKKTKRKAKVLSPLPAAEGEPIPEVVTSQVSGPITVELSVNMHCEACAEQLKRKILKMRGVQTATTERSSGKVTVTGTMDANKLVDYVYRRTKKQARIVPQPEPGKKEKAKKGKFRSPNPNPNPNFSSSSNGMPTSTSTSKRRSTSSATTVAVNSVAASRASSSSSSNDKPDPSSFISNSIVPAVNQQSKQAKMQTAIQFGQLLASIGSIVVSSQLCTIM